MRQFTGSTHTFALEWVQEVPTHLAVVSRRSRRVVHTPHVIGGALQGETGTRTESREALASYGGAELLLLFFFLKVNDKLMEVNGQSSVYSPLATHPYPQTLRGVKGEK